MEKQFQLIKELPNNPTGSLICKINCTPEETFLFLEKTYGKYINLMSGITFIDNKSNWHWFLKSMNGILNVYDFKGSVSIGSVGDGFFNETNSLLKEDADELKKIIEAGVLKLGKNHRELIDGSITSNKFPNFLNTFEPVIMLLTRANREGFLLEGLILSVSIIDAMLRQCLMLHKQIEEKTDQIFDEYIFQDGNKYLSEKSILEESHKKSLIDKAFYGRIGDFYNQRNVAVHRYFISTFQYQDIEKVLNENSDLIPELNKILYKIEERQILEGVGMTKHLKKEEKINNANPFLRISSDVVRKSEIETPKIKSMFDEDWG